METRRFNPFNVFNGIFIPEAVSILSIEVLSSTAKIVYGRLLRYAGRDGVAFPYRDTLALEVGMSISGLDKILKELKDFGLIEAERVGLGYSNRYFFLWHEIFEVTQPCPTREVEVAQEDNSELPVKATALLRESIEESHTKENNDVFNKCLTEDKQPLSSVLDTESDFSSLGEDGEDVRLEECDEDGLPLPQRKRSSFASRKPATPPKPRAPRRPSCRPEVKQVIELFASINPLYKSFYDNKYQIQAVEQLLASQPLDKIEVAILKVIPHTKDDRYAPKINSPQELVEKWQKLKDWVERQNENK